MNANAALRLVIKAQLAELRSLRRVDKAAKSVTSGRVTCNGPGERPCTCLMCGLVRAVAANLKRKAKVKK